MRSLRILCPSLASLVVALGATACSGSLDVGVPLPGPPATNAPAPLPAPTAPALPSTGAPSDTYGWQWVNPSSTGVHFRATAVLSATERYFAGDAGTVVREVAGKSTVIRQGARDELLSAMWVRAADDIWVGGAKGTGGILVHWDGKRWSDSYPVATAPIDALHGGPNGGLFVVVKGHGLYMHPSGATSATCSSLYTIRDVWAESPTVVFYVGDEGIARQTFPDQVCTKVDARPSFGVWGDGAQLFVAQTTPSGKTAIVRRVDSTFVPMGEPFGEPQSTFATRRGKTLAGDAAGNPVVLLHSERLDVAQDALAAYDPGTSAFVVRTLEQGEGIYGLASGAGQLVMAGMRGLHGEVRDGAPVSRDERNRLSAGLPATDGAVFARCSKQYERDTTMCRFDEGRWTRLPVIASYHSAAAVAAAKDSLWLGGFETPSPNTPTNYFASQWNGVTWSRDLAGTTYMVRPLYASNARDVWAASDYKTIHFDGTRWSVRATGGPGTGGFLAADGNGPNDVWLVDNLLGLSHWDGTSIRHVAPFPTGNTGTGLAHSVVADGRGVWLIASSTQVESPYVSYSRVLHWNGAAWALVDLPGLAPRALSRSPDGKVRMIAAVNEYPAATNGGTTANAVWVVSDAGVQKELDLPSGVELLDLFATRDATYAIGEGGATLRFGKVEAVNGTR